mgnify:CR=1 FL=1
MYVFFIWTHEENVLYLASIIFVGITKAVALLKTAEKLGLHIKICGLKMTS